jgi:hypothetical protein
MNNLFIFKQNLYPRIGSKCFLCFLLIIPSQNAFYCLSKFYWRQKIPSVVWDLIRDKKCYLIYFWYRVFHDEFSNLFNWDLHFLRFFRWQQVEFNSFVKLKFHSLFLTLYNIILPHFIKIIFIIIPKSYQCLVYLNEG